MDGRRKKFAKQKDAEESVIENTPSEHEIQSSFLLAATK